MPASSSEEKPATSVHCGVPRQGRAQRPGCKGWPAAASPPQRNAPARLQLQGGEALAERRGMKA